MKVYSKTFDRDLFFLVASNDVAKIYEFLGIYIAYSEKEEVQEDFEVFYTKNASKYLYHYMNKAEVQIKKKLYEKGIKVSRKEMRLLSKTYLCEPIQTSNKMGAILYETILELVECGDICNILFDNRREYDILRCLYFQYNFLLRYLNSPQYHAPLKKRMEFEKVLEEWHNSIKLIVKE